MSMHTRTGRTLCGVVRREIAHDLEELAALADQPGLVVVVRLHVGNDLESVPVYKQPTKARP